MIQGIVAVFIGLALIASLWFRPGPDHIGFIIAITLMGIGFSLFWGSSFARYLPSRFFVIPSGIIRVFRILGAEQFGKLLRKLGWRRMVHGKRPPLQTPEDAMTLRPKLEESATGHACGFLLHLVVAFMAGVAGGTESAIYLLLLAIPLHLYPVMWQLIQLKRMQRLLAALPGR